MLSSIQIFPILPPVCLKVRYSTIIWIVWVLSWHCWHWIGDRSPFLAAKSVCLSGKIYFTWGWCQSVSGPEKYLPKTETHRLTFIMTMTIQIGMRLNNSWDVWTLFKQCIVISIPNFLLLRVPSAWIAIVSGKRVM